MRSFSAYLQVVTCLRIKPKPARACFTETSLNGVYSHGVNRFPRFIQQLDAGHIVPEAEPQKVLSLGAIEQWDSAARHRQHHRARDDGSCYGPGIGSRYWAGALRNANHWMRGGSYGWQAAEKGFVGICWTNSIAVMPPWGAKSGAIGTNPLIIAVPGEPITMVDMSMSISPTACWK